MNVSPQDAPKPASQLPRKPLLVAAGLVGLLVCMFALSTRGCISKKGRDESERYAQILDERKTKTDNLRKAMRFLDQMSSLTRDNYIREVQLELNTWLKDVDRNKASYSPSVSMRKLPPEMLQPLGAGDPLALSFSYWDVDYLYECRLMKKLSQWIVDFPVRDSLLESYIEAESAEHSDLDSLKLAEAYKLFDWSVRNILLSGEQASVEQLADNPSLSTGPTGLGTRYLPSEALMFSTGDFVVRGRVFCNLAAQRNINTFWLAVDAADSPGKLWTIGVVIGESIYLFEPKLGMPILDPDKIRLATLNDAQANERVMRRLDLPGQFDYKLASTDLKDLKVLLDITPCSDSARMKLLQSELLQDERMVVYQDPDARLAEITKLIPGVSTEVWEVPMMAQLQAAATREMLETTTPDAMRYLAVHGVWMLDNPAAQGRLKHMRGQFENTPDGQQGALDLYMDSRIDDKRIQEMAWNPDIQRELGVVRLRGEPKEQFDMRLGQIQGVYARAKIDAAFLLGQLHFDRGNYTASQGFLKRVVNDDRAAVWHPAAWYTLSRVQQELGNTAEASESLAYQPTPQEAGNRLRLRYLQRTQPTPSPE